MFWDYEIAHSSIRQQQRKHSPSTTTNYLFQKPSARVYQLSEREKHFESTNYPNQSRCKAPPDWLRTTMARIVPSLTLAKTEDHSYTLHLTYYTLHLTGRSRIFLHRAFFARHYSLPARQPSVFARLARWQQGRFVHGQFKRIAQEIEKNSTDELRSTTHKEGIRKMALKWCKCPSSLANVYNRLEKIKELAHSIPSYFNHVQNYF